MPYQPSVRHSLTYYKQFVSRVSGGGAKPAVPGIDPMTASPASKRTPGGAGLRWHNRARRSIKSMRF